MSKEKPRIIISGGGTGGHIFPALSIAASVREACPEAEILFVGAEGKMEMEKVPSAGYRIEGLPVAGLQRRLTFSNLVLPFKVWKSIRMAKKIVRNFKPDVAVGVGGYASAPLLWCASRMGIPTLIQEQNSYAGLTNKILGRRASRICTAYEGMDKFFPAEKIILTGNPIRKEIRQATHLDKEDGYRHFNLNPKKKTLLVVGGSLGCRTLNESMKKWIEEGGAQSGYQVIWQSGEWYNSSISEFLKLHPAENVRNFDFIKRMDLAFAVADVVISRAGAGTISELCIAGKTTVFVPSPNVAEDHQTPNAMALVRKNAAYMVRDDEAVGKLMAKAEELLADDVKRSVFEKNILTLGKKDAGKTIAAEVLNLIKE